MRKILVDTKGDIKVQIYYSHQWNEYTVKLYIKGVYQTHSDYFTDDKQDAYDTAQHMLNNTKVEA